MVSQQQLHGHWSEVKAQLQQRWGHLTDDELMQAKGDVNELVGTLEKRTGQAREEVEEYLNSLLGECDSAVNRVGEATREYGREAVDTVRDYSQQVGEVAKEQYDHAAATVRDGYEKAQRQVRQRPTESIAVSFGAGLIAGAIMGLVLKSRA